MQSLTVAAPAKVNLFLGVGPRRHDGYHSVQTVLHTLALADTVRLTPADDLTVACDRDLGVPAEHNLAFRAATAFAAAFGVDVLLDIHITKRIPSGAGLGGGSSDAAAVLAGLAHWANLPLDNERLLIVARSIGADVPFFLLGGAALMGGRGDTLTRRLKPIAAHVALVKPPQAVSTAEAYAAFDGAPLPAGESRAIADALRTQDVRAVADALSNNMTAASAALVPQISEALAWLGAQHGVLGSAMAGSGSAVFALCETADDAERIAKAAIERGWWSAATQTASPGVVATETEVAE